MSAFYQKIKAKLLFKPCVWFLSALIFRSGIYEKHRGIVIAELGPDENRNPHFFNQTKEALDFIAMYDPRRYLYVVRHLKAILCVTQSSSLSKALLDVGICTILFSIVQACSERMRTPFYACLLIHEATHFRIAQRNIPYRGSAKQKIEVLCVKEEVRFIKNLSKHLPSETNELRHYFSGLLDSLSEKEKGISP